jgi:predicted unusual protein kinase regulating ubiquinone biosynthesis (AarF/ABC1/UbiB family)
MQIQDGGGMEKNKTQKQFEGIPLPETDPSDLRGRQSVRATFRLTKEAISALNIVAVHLGIKQKSLFDHLVEDIQSLELIAQQIGPKAFKHRNRVQKTFVLSRKTLTCLEKASKTFDAPRDVLVEYSIKRLLPVLSKEQKKHEFRKQVASELETYLEQGEKILNKARSVLGEDDPVFTDLLKAMSACKTAQKSIHNFVEKGSAIEDFQLDYTS